jgi:hypothetical protein
MKSFSGAVVWGAGVALGACIVWFIVFPWIRSW